MRVFDAHVHYGFWEKLFTRDAETGFLETLSEVCADAGIVKVALLANPGLGNAKLSKALEARPDLVVAMGRLELDHDPVSLVEEFYQRGFHGIKISGVSRNYDDPAYFPYYEAACASFSTRAFWVVRSTIWKAARKTRGKRLPPPIPRMKKSSSPGSAAR